VEFANCIRFVDNRLMLTALNVAREFVNLRATHQVFLSRSSILAELWALCRLRRGLCIQIRHGKGFQHGPGTGCVVGLFPRGQIQPII
jgi:hypothetical protein